MSETKLGPNGETIGIDGVETTAADNHFIAAFQERLAAWEALATNGGSIIRVVKAEREYHRALSAYENRIAVR